MKLTLERIENLGRSLRLFKQDLIEFIYNELVIQDYLADIEEYEEYGYERKDHIIIWFVENKITIRMRNTIEEEARSIYDNFVKFYDEYFEDVCYLEFFTKEKEFKIIEYNRNFLPFGKGWKEDLEYFINKKFKNIKSIL